MGDRHGLFLVVALAVSAKDAIRLDVQAPFQRSSRCGLLLVVMSLVEGPLGGWSCDRLLEDGWVVVALMVGKYISMVVWDRRRRDLLVRAG